MPLVNHIINNIQLKSYLQNKQLILTMKNNHTAISKFLSYVLRHHPESIGIQLDSEGWADVDTLLQQAQKHNRPLTRQMLEEVVENNSKKRFTLSEDGTRIRAAQGHSTTQVNIQYTPTQPPEVLYHGTAIQFVDSIRAQGLLAGSRHHVHLSADVVTAKQVGQRHGKPVVLHIQAKAMTQAGHLFYLSDNGVWLTEHVPAKFISIV